MREDKDLLQKDIAEYLQCTQACYSNYEIGKRDIPAEVLLKLAAFYNTSVDYLLDRTSGRAVSGIKSSGAFTGKKKKVK